MLAAMVASEAQIRGWRVVLASASPRRLEILRTGGLEVEVRASGFEENLDKARFTPAQYVEETALGKARDVFAALEGEAKAGGGAVPDLVIGADTVVLLDGRILEKPPTKEEAVRMLLALSGCSNEVFSGVALLRPRPGGGEPLVRRFHERTTVRFSEMSEEVVRAYVETGEPMDKAGAYGIQGLGSSLVEGIDGCYFNVVGFPLSRFCRELADEIRPAP